MLHGISTGPRTVCLSVCAFLLGNSLPANEPELSPLSIEETIETRILSEGSSIQVSQDRAWLAVALRKSTANTRSAVDNYLQHGVPWYGLGADIYIIDLRTAASRNLTGGMGNNWQPMVSPDGRYLAFLSDRDGSGQAKLWVWTAETNNLRKVCDIAVRTHHIAWMRDSRQIIITAVPEGLTVEEYSAKISRPLGPNAGENEVRAPGSSVVIYRANLSPEDAAGSHASEPWNLRIQLSDLINVDVVTGHAKRLDRGHVISWFLPCPDGIHIAFTSPQRFEKSGSQQVRYNVYIVSTMSGEVWVAAPGIQLFDGTSVSWSPDGDWLSYRTAGPEANGDCFVVRADGGHPRNVTNLPPEKMPSSGQPPAWDVSGQSIWFIRGGSVWKTLLGENRAIEVANLPSHEIRQLITLGSGLLWSIDGGGSTVVLTFENREKKSGFYKIDLATGKGTKLVESEQCFTCGAFDAFTVTPDTKALIYSAQDVQHDTDLWLTDAQFSGARRLTYINPQFGKYRMGAARLIEWRGLDGEALHGALLMPAGYTEGKKYPLIVNVYGGSFSSDQLKRFGLGAGGPGNMQLFATRGYAVLLPDAPQHLGTPMLDLAKTVLPGVDKVIDIGIADSGRIGVMGHSYGGYTTLSLLVQTKRFKAAAMVDGYGDLIGSYGQMDKEGSSYGVAIQEEGQGLMGGSPWQFRERYLENSPIFYLDRVDSPLLIVHGGADRIVASFLGDEVFVGLRRLGKKVEYARFEGEDHSPLYWTHANQLDYCRRIIRWFDQYLKTPPA